MAYEVETKARNMRGFNTKMRRNAEKATDFGGKRFLGWTANGTEAWVSFNVNKDTKELSVSSTVNLDLLLDDDARLADARVTVKRNATNRHDVEQMLRISRHNQGGKVTKQTVKYLIKLLNAVEGESPLAFEKGVPTTGLIRLLSGSIYEGSVSDESVDFRWSDVTQYWGFPKGQYFTVDALGDIS
jgi:hypothetical protein